MPRHGSLTRVLCPFSSTGKVAVKTGRSETEKWTQSHGNGKDWISGKQSKGKNGPGEDEGNNYNDVGYDHAIGFHLNLY